MNGTYYAHTVEAFVVEQSLNLIQLLLMEVLAGDLSGQLLGSSETRVCWM